MVKQGSQIKDILPFLPKRRIRGLYSRVYALGLKSGSPRTKHSKNEAFWETPNPINSYFAGLGAADMSINTTSRFALSWQCHVKDESAMARFIKETGYTGKIFYVTEKSPCSENTATHSCLRVSACQKWAIDLSKNFNIVSGKTHRLQPPNVTSDFLKCCYLIGMTDGDGCISIGKPQGYQEMPVVSYVSASQDIIQWIRDFVDSKFPFSNRRNPKRGTVNSSVQGTYHHCRIYGMQAIKLFDFLRRIDVPKFARKWDNPAFLALVETYRQKWPEFFTPDKELSFDSAGNIVFASSLVVAPPPLPTIQPISLEHSLVLV